MIDWRHKNKRNCIHNNKDRPKKQFYSLWQTKPGYTERGARDK